MDNKKVDFLLTPRINYSNSKYRTKNNSSTPFAKGNELPSFSDCKFDDLLGTTNLANITGISVREKSTLYPSVESPDRMVRESELLRIKFLNHKCRNLIEESNKKVENKIKKSVCALNERRERQLNRNGEIELKQLLHDLIETTDLILEYLNDRFPIEHLHKLDEQLKRYKQILIPSLNYLQITNIANGHRLNELFEMLDKTEFTMLMSKSEEIVERRMAIDEEKHKKNEQIHRINRLATRFLDLVDLVKCLSNKDLI